MYTFPNFDYPLGSGSMYRHSVARGFGKVGTTPPAQIVELVPKLNVGVIFGLTVTVKRGWVCTLTNIGRKIIRT
jgi:hypothetical protein